MSAARSAVVLLIVAGGSLAAFAQTGVPARPPLVIQSTVGHDLFDFYCATCHGRDGRGHGPVVVALKRPPPDLTRLARGNGGVFPRQRVEAFVENDGKTPTPAHGSSDMPVWGPVFRGLDASDTLARVRIANVVEYIGTIQER